VVQGAGATIPVTESTERTLHNRGVNLIQDFITNAGGMNGAGP
jgi:glutamate dehydrogenase/leucine dehydrogenase